VAIVEFPSEYNAALLPVTPVCYSQSAGGARQSPSCEFQGLRLVARLGRMESNVTVVVDGVTNPAASQTGNFLLRVLYSNSTWATANLGALHFFGGYPESTGATFTYDSLKYQESTLWNLTVPFTVSLPAQVTVRVFFPEMFRAGNPRCTIAGVPETPVFTFLKGQTVDCQGISTAAIGSSPLRLLVSGVFNPDRAGTFSGAKVFLINPTSWAILESIALSVITIPKATLEAATTFPTQFQGDFQKMTASFNLNYQLG
jgi:hypothetical protein